MNNVKDFFEVLASMLAAALIIFSLDVMKKKRLRTKRRRDIQRVMLAKEIANITERGQDTVYVSLLALQPLERLQDTYSRLFEEFQENGIIDK